MTIQNIILDTDGTWEYSLNPIENNTSPCERPLNSADSEITLFEKLYTFLKKESVDRRFNYLISKYMDRLAAHKTISYEISLVLERRKNEALGCTLFNTKDKETGDIITRSGTTQILTCTSNKLLNYNKNKIYLSPSSCIVEQDEGFYLEFELIINSKNIRKAYRIIPTIGFIRANKIKVLDIFLENKQSEPKIENFTGRTIYPLKCKIKYKDDLLKLKSNMLTISL